MFRVIVAGSRGFSDYQYCCSILDKAFSKTKPDSIVCGMAKGADSLGQRYAVDHQIAVDEFPADWDTFGKSAGYKRNVQMAENAEALVAFWDGQSRGTMHMINIARERGLKVIICKYNEHQLYKLG